ncbi:hypothetical protein F4804DRAFT_329330 [Jackrogersella minutella]|nr:hypothetical protein F4804DRAFT_329330 [Jackrogersella minutella]
MSYHSPSIPPHNEKHISPLQNILFLKIAPTENIAANQIAPQSNYSLERDVIVAAAQLIEHQQRHGCDAVPPEDVFASWLEENKDWFIEARRIGRERGRGRNATLQPRTLVATRPMQGRMPSSYVSSSRLPGSQQNAQMFPGHHAERWGQETSLPTGICAAVYPADRAEQAQLDGFENTVLHDHHKGQDELPQESSMSVQGPTDHGQDRRSTPIADNHGIVDQRLRVIEDDSNSQAIDAPHPIAPRSSGTAITLDRSQREAAPSPPEQGRFHISQVAHLAPTYIAAERSRSLRDNRGPSYDGQSFDVGDTNSSNTQAVGRQQDRHINLVGNRDAIRDYIRAAGFLSGEVWIDGEADECVGMRFVARPLGEERLGEGKGGRAMPRVVDRPRALIQS